MINQSIIPLRLDLSVGHNRRKSTEVEVPFSSIEGLATPAEAPNPLHSTAASANPVLNLFRCHRQNCRSLVGWIRTWRARFSSALDLTLLYPRYLPTHHVCSSLPEDDDLCHYTETRN
jgi:hypothetical protein